MQENQTLHRMLQRIQEQKSSLTPKGRILAGYIIDNPRQAVFLKTRELAAACGVSEATVVRFVATLGYHGYSEFIQALREVVDTELTLLDRVELVNNSGPSAERTLTVVKEEIDNLTNFYQNLDLEALVQAVDLLTNSPYVYVIGSRLSYTFAYYLGWSLTKIRNNVNILRGSDSTCIDWLATAPKGSLVIIFATSRYPNELIRIAKLVLRLGMQLIVIADSNLCPINQFAKLSIVVRCLHFPLVGSPSSMSCLTNCIISEMAAKGGDSLREHQARLEDLYRENDILFNL